MGWFDGSASPAVLPRRDGVGEPQVIPLADGEQSVRRIRLRAARTSFDSVSATANGLIGVARKVLERVRERPLVVDATLAALAAVLALAELQSGTAFTGRDLDRPGALLVIVGSSALVWRRRTPVATLAATTAAMVAIYIRDYGSFVAMMGLIAIYSVAAHGRDRRLAWSAIVTAGVVLFVTACFTILDPPEGFRGADAISMIVLLVSAAAGGGIVRNRQEIFADTRDRAERAEAERTAEAERAVTRERARIAREMHDVVAHGMSVIAVQATAAQQVVHDDPDRAVELMRNVEVTGRQSLDSLRRMLGVLRSGDEIGRTLSPQPGLKDVLGAVEQTTAAGVPTELVVTGSVRELAPGLELNAFRIVQEALTNVRKHAGTAATAEVHIDYTATALTIDVTDDGAGMATSLEDSGAAHGLVGMRERVDLYGGSFSAGARTGGGFRVHIGLPTSEQDRRTLASASGQASGADPA